MTLDERVTRLEQRIDQLERIETSITGLRADFNAFRKDTSVSFERVLTTLDSHNRTLREILTILPTLGFRWPWEKRP